MNKKLTKIGSGAAGLALLLVIIGATTMILKSLRFRADLTAEKLYTLSDGSRKVMGQLEEDVTLKFYYSASSAEMPQALKNYAVQVQDYLKEYELAGKGHVTLESYDPQPDSDAEEWAQRYGIAQQQVNPFGQPVYFGLAAVCGDRQEVIEGFSPRSEATLEYDITRLITRVAWPEKPVIGVMSALDVLGGEPNPMMMQMGQRPPQGWIVFRELKKDYTVREIKTDAEKIDDDVKTLIVVHPKNLEEKALYAIDQFVLRGGRLIACVDPFSVVDFMTNGRNQQMMMMGGGGPNQPGPSTLGKLFDKWGVSFDTSKVVADLSLSTKLNAGNNRAESNPAFLSLTTKNMAKGDLLVSQLTSVMLPFSGALSGKNTDALKFTPVIVSSQDNACMIDQMSAQFGMSAMQSQLNPDGVERVLAARLEGTFETAFPDGFSAGTNDTASATNKVASLKSGKSTVLVFADSDFLGDNFCVTEQQTLFGNILQPLNDNLTLFANVVEQFAGRAELIGVRARGQFNRPFVKVDELEASAMKKWQAEEARFQQELNETRSRLQALQKAKSGNDRFILSREQQQEIQGLRAKQAETQRQLKEVRKNLHADIDRLGTKLKTINIGLVPVLVILFGIFHGIYRRKR